MSPSAGREASSLTAPPLSSFQRVGGNVGAKRLKGLDLDTDNLLRHGIAGSYRWHFMQTDGSGALRGVA